MITSVFSTCCVVCVKILDETELVRHAENAVLGEFWNL